MLGLHPFAILTLGTLLGPGSTPGEPQAESVQEAPAGESVSAETVQALAQPLFALGYATETPDAEQILADLERLRPVARAWADDVGAYLGYAERIAARALERVGRRPAAIEILEESLAWRSADHVGAEPDWYLALETIDRINLLAEYLVLIGDSRGCMQNLRRLDEHLERARSGEFSQRAPDAQTVAGELDLRRTLALQSRADAELLFGLSDRAARTIAVMEREFEARWGSEPSLTLAGNASGIDDLFWTRRLRCRLLLALDRPEGVAPLVETMRVSGEFELFSKPQQSALALFDAVAAFELERTGAVEFGEWSPFAGLLELESEDDIRPQDRVETLLAESARLSELGEVAQARERLEQFRLAAQETRQDNVQIDWLTLGTELRAMHLAVDRSGSAEAQALIDVRARFTALLERLGGGATGEFGSTILYYGAGTEVLSELIELELALEPGQGGLRRGLDHALAVQEVGGLAARMGLEPGAIDRVAEAERLLAGTGQGGVLYVPGRNQSRVFLVRKLGLTSHALAPDGRLEGTRAALEQELTTFVGLAGRAGAESLRLRATELAELLLPEALRAELRELNELAVMGPGNLGYVPFELLELEPGRPLGTELAVHYWPSARVAGHLTEAPAGAPVARDLALLVRTELAEDPRGFRLATDEIDALLEAFDPDRRIAVSGELATQTWLLGPEAQSRSWLIIAHGERPGGGREASSLVIPDGAGESLLNVDSAFWLSDQLDVPPLVWLGACSAWEGPFRRGDDGATHLPSRFLQHGARSVVLPFVEVRFGDLSELVRRTHAELVDSPGELSMAEALRRARVASIEAAEDDLAEIAPLLVHELGGVSPRLRFASRPAPGGLRANWMILGGLALGFGMLPFAVRSRRAAAAGRTSRSN